MKGVTYSDDRGPRAELFFFLKQKTAYGLRLGIVGSERCIRDRAVPLLVLNQEAGEEFAGQYTLQPGLNIGQGLAVEPSAVGIGELPHERSQRDIGQTQLVAAEIS